MLILITKTVVTAHANLDIFDVAFDSMSVTFVAFLGQLQALHFADAMLFDIPLHEEVAPQQCTHSKRL